MSDWTIDRARPVEHPHVEIVTIDRPPVNALVDGMYRELAEIFASFADDPDIRCAILTATGSRAFVAGADVNEFVELAPSNGASYMRVRREAFRAMHECAIPVIGAVNGPALGAGLVLCTLCDILVACERASFGLPEINVGVLGGAKHFSRLVPAQVLRRMALTGERIPATELQSYGGISRVVPQDRVLEAALEIADQIAAKSPTATRLAKDALNLIESMTLETGYHVEQLHTLILSASADSKEAVSAFLEGRLAQF